MTDTITERLKTEIESIRQEGLFKEERLILGPQSARVRVPEGEVLNFCANNYLGLSSHPELLKAARAALDTHGYGMSSVRFICGTQDIHRKLEKTIASFLGMDDAILYTSCFDANGGLFETLLGPEDAVISDALNHASIIDGIRLCKAQRHRYPHSDMKALENTLRETKETRIRLIATDGVFSMDGDMARLDEICTLADKYAAMVMVDDSHASGFIGKTGRGTPEHFGVMDRVDIATSTLGKALGGASGGFTAARQSLVDFLRQRSRPYLFSNTLAPVIVGASLKCLDLLSSTTALRDKLESNTAYFRKRMLALGFDIKPGETPICPIMLHEAKLAQDFAAMMLQEGIYVIGFSYPVVPKDKARIRVQISAGHEKDDLDRAIAAFERVGKRLRVLKG